MNAIAMTDSASSSAGNNMSPVASADANTLIVLINRMDHTMRSNHHHLMTQFNIVERRIDTIEHEKVHDQTAGLQILLILIDRGVAISIVPNLAKTSALSTPPCEEGLGIPPLLVPTVVRD